MSKQEAVSKRFLTPLYTSLSLMSAAALVFLSCFRQKRMARQGHGNDRGLIESAETCASAC
eukprot:764833-Hanusia_phi.AAC.2